MAARPTIGGGKLFINMVEDPEHVANQIFINDAGAQVVINIEEATALLAWRNQKQIIFKVQGEVCIIPGIDKDRLTDIFSVFDLVRPWRTQEDVDRVLAVRRLGIAIEASIRIRPDHWRFVFDLTLDNASFDQLIILSSRSGDIHLILPGHSTVSPLRHVHVFRAAQTNPLMQHIQTTGVTSVPFGLFFTLLHMFWDADRLKSTLVNYKQVVQVGILFVRMPETRLLAEIVMARLALFQHLQNERVFRHDIESVLTHEPSEVSQKEEEEEEEEQGQKSEDE